MDPVGQQDDGGSALHVDQDGRTGISRMLDRSIRVEQVAPRTAVGALLVPAERTAHGRVVAVLMHSGLPLMKITFSMIDMTRSAGIDIDISCATASLLLSSSMFNTRNVLPLSILSLTKSIDHVLFGSKGASNGSFTRLGRRLFKRLRLLKWIFLYTRYTFLWFQGYPS